MPLPSRPQPPLPSHILRIHAAHISQLSFSADNERLYSGDVSGTVSVISTRSLRPIATWNAHGDGILGIQEWNGSIITHGRDNKLHAWTAVFALSVLSDAATEGVATIPTRLYTLDVNALNFCRFSLLQPEIKETGSSSSTPLEALIAVPNLIDSSLADIWELPTCSRIHAAIGRLESPDPDLKAWQPDSDGRGSAKTGILMSLHLFRKGSLHLLAAYESGEVILRARSGPEMVKSVEGRGWDMLWKARLHVESVMSMAMSADCTFALTTSADHVVGRYDLFSDSEERFRKCRTKQPGNASVAVIPDGRVCAIGGWDGKIRLFSTKSFKPLGTLQYHGNSCQAIAFANPDDLGNGQSWDDAVEDERKQIRRWVACGAQDSRISIWELMDFRAR